MCFHWGTPPELLGLHCWLLKLEQLFHLSGRFLSTGTVQKKDLLLWLCCQGSVGSAGDSAAVTSTQGMWHPRRCPRQGLLLLEKIPAGVVFTGV